MKLYQVIGLARGKEFQCVAKAPNHFHAAQIGFEQAGETGVSQPQLEVTELCEPADNRPGLCCETNNTVLYRRVKGRIVRIASPTDRFGLSVVKMDE